MADEYNHIQSSGSDTWTVTHNLAADAVVCDVYALNNGITEKIIPLNVVHTSNNSLTITFSTSRTGRARVVAR